MTASRAAGLFEGLSFGMLMTTAASRTETRVARPADAKVRLFRVVTMREDVLLGLTPAEMAALGSGPEVERLAVHIATEGQVTGWRYRSERSPNGGTQLATHHRVAVLRQDALMLEPYAPALPVVAPPRD
jgi:hypothetical protein